MRIDTKEAKSILVLDSRAIGKNPRQREERITTAMPIPLTWMVQAGLGRKKMKQVMIKDNQLFIQSELKYAGKTIHTQIEPPPQEFLHACAAKAFCLGIWHSQYLEKAIIHHRNQGLAKALKKDFRHPPLEQWIQQHLIDLGIEEYDDLHLIEGL